MVFVKVFGWLHVLIRFCSLILLFSLNDIQLHVIQFSDASENDIPENPLEVLLFHFPMSLCFRALLDLKSFSKTILDLGVYIISTDGIFIWLIIALLLSAIASLLPARSAIRLTVRDVLAYE